MIKLTPLKIAISSVFLAAIALALLAYAYFIEPNRLVVREQTIAISGWNREFDGLRIVMLSDIHGGSNGVTTDRLRELVERVNEQNADIVVLLGDYVSETIEDQPVSKVGLKMSMTTVADNLAGMKAKHGVFAVLGNHDGWYNDDIVASEFTRVGYSVLRHEVAAIEMNGQRLRIFGMIDHLKLNKSWRETSADAKAIVDTSGSGDLIVLQHSPDLLPVITGDLSISGELKLMLAGHTHGGQVRFPVVGAPIVPSTFGQKYARGHVRDRGIDLFVTSGVGCSVLPFRFMVPPEIVVLTIKSALVKVSNNPTER